MKSKREEVYKSYEKLLESCTTQVFEAIDRLVKVVKLRTDLQKLMDPNRSRSTEPEIEVDIDSDGFHTTHNVTYRKAYTKEEEIDFAQNLVDSYCKEINDNKAKENTSTEG